MKQVRAFLIHGTWGATADWKDEGSAFRSTLEATLKNLGREVDFVPIPWSAANSHDERLRIGKSLVDKLEKAERTDNDQWEYLVVAHSHGGNIATDAVRDWMNRGSGKSMLGIICLNTPFLKHELRAWGNYLVVWLVLLLLAALALGPWSAPPTSTFQHAVDEVSQYFGGYLRREFVFSTLIALALALLGVVLLGKKMRLSPAPIEPYSSVRPKVLCLSCPDDEAITFLGLLEGVSNLPQLLLHPLFVAPIAATVPVLLFFTGHREFCSADLYCWASNAYLLSCVLALWVLVALTGGLLGSLVVKIAFGLPTRGILENLLSRVLVSYAPLRPADVYFRGITEITHKWFTPFQLLHSQIYRSPQTFSEIGKWLTFVAAHRDSTAAPQRNAA
jgi:hypothetical protein